MGWSRIVKQNVDLAAKAMSEAKRIRGDPREHEPSDADVGQIEALVDVAERAMRLADVVDRARKGRRPRGLR